MPEDTVADAIRNIEYASKLGIPHLDVQRPRPGKCVLVGGGLSANQYQDDIRSLRYLGRNYLISLNWMHNWLLKRGVVPHACVFFEIDVDVSGVLGSPHPDVTYFVCSHCHPSTHEALRGFKTILWHAKLESPEIGEAQSKFFPGEPLLSGGMTTLIRAIDVGRVLGYRQFELFGCDSSFYRESPTHVPGYPLDGHEAGGQLDRIPIKVWEGEAFEEFWTTQYLATQAEQFRQWCAANHMTFLMRVHGQGLLRSIHERAWPEQYDE